MEPRKEWLRKPQYNPPTSQEKAGFSTYSFLKGRTFDGAQFMQ
jgi:hypothetical protein